MWRYVCLSTWGGNLRRRREHRRPFFRKIGMLGLLFAKSVRLTDRNKSIVSLVFAKIWIFIVVLFTLGVAVWCFCCSTAA